MRVDWTALRQELAVWHRDGLRLPFWWRDDDAIAPTKALKQLENLGRNMGVPVHLAIIPANVDQALVEHISDVIVPVVHGWSHQNNAPLGQKKAEFGAGRDLDLVRQELQRGLERMNGVFGARFSKMFVAPWNRLSADVLSILQDVGFTTVSTFQSRTSAQPIAGLEQVNTHIDPIFWRGARGLVEPVTLVSQTVELLEKRRRGILDAAEPLGYLTHHLVHDAEIWEFSRQFLTEICEGPVTLYRHDKKDIS
ncbi:polysaccharide deacetylase family protein [Shimia abyssi]|uniref:Polysaccharide deacetylase n=1 Tax=Shimia abyssi TaxID=1662395 RepID=A0A2P8FAJ8_9RHOB|nr:polysaccharide deacetylase family protein [Shimia abyssi]PSL18756.1 hypothetical protein CLV88_109141 [Shimia abyssi]